MKSIILLPIIALLVSACGPAAGHTAIQRPAATNQQTASDASNGNPSGAPSAEDMALANQIAQVPLDNGPSDTSQAADAPGGDYMGQPLAERAAQGALPQAHDGLWVTLATTRIHEDEARGLYSATHPEAVRALIGQNVTLSGFIMPLETTEHFRHFILTRYTPVCPFCPPGAPNEVVEVWSSDPIVATNDLVRISGQFSLTNDGEKGLFFQLRSAHLLTQAAALDTRHS